MSWVSVYPDPRRGKQVDVSPLATVPLVALPFGVMSYAVIRRWPHRDPLLPRVAATVVQEIHRHPRLRRLLRSRMDPATETGLLLTVTVGVVVVSVAAFGIIAEMVRANRGLASYDLFFARWGAHHATPASTTGLKLVSLLGGYPPVVLLSCVVAVAEYRRRLFRNVVPLLMLVVGGQFAVTNLIKFTVDRARPNIAQLTGFAGTSFPSGHAAAAAATYAVFALVLGRRRSPRVKSLLGGVAVSIAVAVAATRVLLGVHWFTDVLAGVFIGWAWFASVSLAFGGRVMRFGAPVVLAEITAEPKTVKAAQLGDAPAEGVNRATN